MWNIIEFGGIIFWAIFAVFFFFEMRCVYTEHVGKSLIPIAVFAVVMWAFSSVGAAMLPFVQSNWAWMLLYLPVGIAWAVFKWFRFSIKRARIYKQALTDAHVNTINDIDRSHISSFFHTLNSMLHDGSIFTGLDGIKQSRSNVNDWVVMNADVFNNVKREVLLRVMGHPRNHVQKISVWIIWWPVSILNALLFDFLRELGETIVHGIKGLLLQVSKAAFRTQSQDFQNLDTK